MDSNKIKKGLGRGLSSLIGESNVETKKINYLLEILFQTSINLEKFLMRII